MMKPEAERDKISYETNFTMIRGKREQWKYHRSVWAFFMPYICINHIIQGCLKCVKLVVGQ